MKSICLIQTAEIINEHLEQEYEDDTQVASRLSPTVINIRLNYTILWW